MIVRKAFAGDLEQLSRLFDGYRQFYQQSSDIEGARGFIEQRLQNKDSVLLVVEAAGQLQGFTQLYPSFSSVSMQRLWILNDLYVDANVRNKGVARALMGHAKQLADETNSKGLILETDTDNINAQALYDDLGYKQQNSTLHYFLATEQA